MNRTCGRCGSAIPETAPRYERAAGDGSNETFCSLNCLAGTDEYDEREVRDRLFETARVEA